MKKYVIKNCPCFIEGTIRKGYDFVKKGCNYYKLDKLTKCEDYTDCLLKQIVEKCKLQAQGIGMPGKNFAEKILELLDIEECE